jgi:hypothetical protein
MVSGLAFIVFIINTGIFNGLAEQIWGPVRRHLEGLIPLAPVPRDPAAQAADLPDAAEQNDQANDRPGMQQPGAAVPAGTEALQRRRRPGELDPAETAARLLEQHRQANAGWLLTQIRRAEHSLLLFLASLVPGVGERHIRAREAEIAAIEAERQRRIEAAAVAAAAAENAGRNAEGETAGASTENGGENLDRAAEPVQPLVEV